MDDLEKSSKKGSSRVSINAKPFFPPVFSQAFLIRISEYRPVTISWAERVINPLNNNIYVRILLCMIDYLGNSPSGSTDKIVSGTSSIVELSGSFAESTVNQRYTAEPSCNLAFSLYSGFCL
jgi:hypothetical protein